VIAQIMIFALGFLVASLSALLVLPLFWRRARRLARRRIEMSMPLSVNEVMADRDRLRADFAVERCRLEQTLDVVVEKRTVALAAVARMEAALFDMRALAATAERTSEAHAATAQDLTAQLGAATKSLYDAEHAWGTWETRGRSLQNACDRLRMSASADAAANEALDACRRELEANLSETAQQLSTARAGQAAAAEKIETLLAELETAGERAQQAEIFSRATLTRANAEEQRAELLSRSLQQTKRDLEEAQRESETLRREVAKAEARTDALRASLERQAEVRRALDSDVSARLVSAESQISGLKSALDEAKREAADLRRGAGVGPRRRAASGREPRPMKGLEVVTDERPDAPARSGESVLDRPA
jgi:chromosome segregation ATPase